MTAPNPSAPEFQEGYKAGFHEGLEEAHRQTQGKKGGEGGKEGAGNEGKKEQDKPSKPNAFQQKMGMLVRNRTFQVVAGLVVLTVLGIVIYDASRHETTDDAYTAGHIHNIASRVTGTVLEVRVDDNQMVRQGDVLVVLDPTDYHVQVEQAQADYEKAKADHQRALALQKGGAISQQDIDTYDSAEKVAEAKLKDAEDQLEYCIIRAPADGRIGHKTVETGNRINVGAALMAITEDVWVVANFKETQLGQMRPGQEAEISIDAIPDKTFKGHVDSWSPGSGATFALLPPDNATGNFTKIVQRVPVKIRFDADSIKGFENRIVPGLSCEPSVLLGGGEANRSEPLQPQQQLIPISAAR
jgi:membrane fusion protein (multidrug efflux system)